MPKSDMADSSRERTTRTMNSNTAERERKVREQSSPFSQNRARSSLVIRLDPSSVDLGEADHDTPVIIEAFEMKTALP